MLRLPINRQDVARFCREHSIRELALFGSVLRDDFRPDSDVDVLVEFEPEARIGLFDLVRIEEEFSSLLGRRVDLITKGGLNRRLRDRVLASREILYVRTG